MEPDEPLFELTVEDLELLDGGPKGKSKRKSQGNPQKVETGRPSENLGYDPVTLRNNPKYKHDLKMDYEIQRWNGTSWEHHPAEEYRSPYVSAEDVLQKVHKDDRRGTYRIHRFFVKPNREEKE